jgi:hypothetical protein
VICGCPVKLIFFHRLRQAKKKIGEKILHTVSHARACGETQTLITQKRTNKHFKKKITAKYD